MVRRHEAVAKHVIFAEVWSDVIVSDGALSQAVRTLRRALGDDSREPRFIRTVSRHGYQFVGTGVAEASDDDPLVVPVENGQDARADPTDQALDDLIDRFAAAAQQVGVARRRAIWPSACIFSALKQPWRA